MKNRSRIAVLGAALLLGGASVLLVANAADLTKAPAPAAAQQEQTGEHVDATDDQAGDSTKEPAAAGEKQDQAGDKVGHEDVPGTPDQTGDHQD